MSHASPKAHLPGPLQVTTGAPLKEYAWACRIPVIVGSDGKVSGQRIKLLRGAPPVGLVSQVLFLWVDADEHRVSLGIDGDPGIPS
jgi:hypothetical protein